MECSDFARKLRSNAKKLTARSQISHVTVRFPTSLPYELYGFLTAGRIDVSDADGGTDTSHILCRRTP
ncbi:hypothetical protein D3C80_2143060 [compost metagenome]